MPLYMPENAIPVLDSGWVSLVDSVGNDESVEKAARQSYTYEPEERGEKQRSRLIHYLMKNRHMSPFEAVEVQIQFHVPIFVARQIQRHRTFSYNELSGRYKQLQPTFYMPDVADITGKCPGQKQGRGCSLEGGWEKQKEMRDELEYAYDASYLVYKTLLNEGVAEEVARLVLPLGTYTVFTMKGNLRNWLQFLSLRNDSHAQLETQWVAQAVASIVQEIAPMSYSAWLRVDSVEKEARGEIR